LFTLGSFLKTTKVTHIFVLLFSDCVLSLPKNGMGDILGDFITNSSGRRGSDPLGFPTTSSRKEFIASAPEATLAAA
jgi:hypothetical protein